MDRRKFVYAGLGAAIIVIGGIAAYFATRPPEVIKETIVQTVEKPVEKTVVTTVEKPVEKVITTTIEKPVEKVVERTVVSTVAGTPTTIVKTETIRETLTQTIEKTVEVTPTPTEPSGRLIIVHLWAHGGDKKALESELNAFKKKYPKIEIDARGAPGEYYSFLQTSLMAHPPPDVYGFWSFWARYQPLIEGGYVEDITDIWEEMNLFEKMPAVAKLVKHPITGRYYNLPKGVHRTFFWIRPDLWKKKGWKPAETWADFKELLKKIKADGYIPLFIPTKDKWEYLFWFDYLLVRQAPDGPAFHDRLMVQEESYLDPKVKRAFKLWDEVLPYIEPNPAAYGFADGLAAIVNEEAAMFGPQGEWVAQILLFEMKLKPEVNYDFHEFPTIDPDVPKYMVGPVDGWMMNAKAVNKENARLFLKFVASVDGQIAWNSVKGSTSPHIDVPLDIYKDPVTAKIAKRFIRRPHTLDWGHVDMRIFSPIMRVLASYIEGRISSDEAPYKLEEERQKFLKIIGRGK